MSRASSPAATRSRKSNGSLWSVVSSQLQFAAATDNGPRTTDENGPNRPPIWFRAFGGRLARRAVLLGHGPAIRAEANAELRADRSRERDPHWHDRRPDRLGRGARRRTLAADAQGQLREASAERAE